MADKTKVVYRPYNKRYDYTFDYNTELGKKHHKDLWTIHGMESGSPKVVWSALERYYDLSREDLEAMGWKVKRAFVVSESDAIEAVDAAIEVSGVSGGKVTMLRKLMRMVFG